MEDRLILQIGEENRDAVRGMFPPDEESLLEKEDYMAYALVAAETSEPLGVAGFWIREDMGLMGAELDWLFIVPEERQRGNGAFLLRGILDLFQQSPLVTVYALLPETGGQEGMIALLEALDFTGERIFEPEEPEGGSGKVRPWIRFGTELRDEIPLPVTTDEMLMSLREDMDRLLPLFFSVEQRLSEGELVFRTGADSEYGPHLTVKGRRNLPEVRVFISPDPEDPEENGVGLLSERQLSETEYGNIEELLSDWNAAEIFSSCVENDNQRSVTFLTVLPWDTAMEPGALEEWIRLFRDTVMKKRGEA